MDKIESSSKRSNDTFSELSGLPIEYFQENRDRYVANLKNRVPNLNLNSIIVFKGGDDIPLYDTDINYYHFFQESNFYYLTGVREPGLYAILDLKDSKLTLFYDEPPEKNKIWMHVISQSDMQTKYNSDVVPKLGLNDFIQSRNMDTIFILEGVNEYSGKSVGFAELNFTDDKSYLNQKINHEKMIYEVLCDTRSVKSTKEQDLLKYIGDLTNKAHMEIMKNIAPGLYERDLENVFMNYCSENYYTRIWAYPCIGGCGHNSATLHYDKNDDIIKDGDLFLADMGIRLCNYTSDVTITIPANGKFTQKQKGIYDIVLRANRAVISMMKAGETTYPQMEKLSQEIILEDLQKLGLILPGPTVDELYSKKIGRLFMPHGLGHLVGLDVHDVGSRVSYKKERILEEGNLITVEPGIYFIKFVLENAFKNPDQSKYLNVELCRSYIGFGGVRIEDDIYVTSSGMINFQQDLPRTTDEIEAFMQNNNVHILKKKNLK